MDDQPKKPSTPSPWLNTAQAARYLGPKRSAQFVRNEIHAERLRASRLGGRGEFVTCTEWLDDYVRAQSTPVPFQAKRRA